MSPTAFALVVVGALMHAYWNVQMKRARAGVGFIWLFTLIAVAFLAPAGVYRLAQLGWWSDARFLFAAGASALVHVVYHNALQIGYRHGDFSTVYPVARGVAPMMTVVGAAILLSEAVPFSNWIGAGAIAVGIVLLSVKRGEGASTGHKGIGWAILTGISITTYTLIDAWAVVELRVDPLAYYFTSQVFRAILFAPAALATFETFRQAVRDSRREALIIGILSPAAFLMILFAMQLAPVSQVAPLREISMLFGAFAGGMHFGERFGKARLAGIVSIAVGAVLVTLRH
ncbi:MAG TPA: EamA family transporter [Usitatibacter sp.]|nr:EamA family transporter [Usitatibacter sp.]